VFATNWFDIIARPVPGNDAPHYALQTLDYVTVIAITATDGILLVRQYRPAIGAFTLELPSGHVETGQTPEQAAAAELLEETGWQGESFTCFGKLHSDTGRMANSLWCYGTRDVQRVNGAEPEAGIELVSCPRQEFGQWVLDGKIQNALAFGAVSLAELHGWALLGRTEDG
jgi:8-oxo-dGTP pyrophosphatase MutT (NUDIX family)